MFYRKRLHSCMLIEFTDDEVKFAEFNVDSGQPVSLNKFFADSRPSAEGLPDYLAKVFSSNSFSKKQVSVLINGTAVYAKRYECPLIQEQEIRQAVEWDESFWTPFSQGEVYADFIRLSSASDQPSKLLAVMLKRTFADKLLAALESLGILTDEITYSPLEALNIIPATVYSYIDCRKDGVSVISVKDSNLENFRGFDTDDYVDISYRIRDYLPTDSLLIVGGVQKELMRELLQSTAAVKSVDVYKQADISDDLSEDYVQPRLSAYLCGAAVRKCQCRM